MELDIAAESIPDLDDVDQPIHQAAPSQNNIWSSHLQSIGSDNVHDGLKLLSELSDKHQFEVMVAIWPEFMNDGIYSIESHPDIVKGTLDQIAAPTQTLAIESICQQQNLPYFRMAPYFRSHYHRLVERGQLYGKSPRELYTVDGMHANILGCDTGAQILKAVIEKETSLLTRQHEMSSEDTPNNPRSP